MYFSNFCIYTSQITLVSPTAIHALSSKGFRLNGIKELRSAIFPKRAAVLPWSADERMCRPQAKPPFYMQLLPLLWEGHVDFLPFALHSVAVNASHWKIVWNLEKRYRSAFSIRTSMGTNTVSSFGFYPCLSPFSLIHHPLFPLFSPLVIPFPRCELEYDYNFFFADESF